MTYWYIHPINQVTNHEVMRRLSATGRGSEDVTTAVTRLALDGKSYDVIAVEYRLLKEMYQATTRRGGDFQFLPFKAETSKTPMDFVPEFLLTRSRQPRKIKEAQTFVDRLSAQKKTLAT